MATAREILVKEFVVALSRMIESDAAERIEVALSSAFAGKGMGDQLGR